MNTDKHRLPQAKGDVRVNTNAPESSSVLPAHPRPAGDTEYFLEEKTRQIIGCAFEVLNTLGCGLLEKPYENALCVEFDVRGIPYRQQPRYDVLYKTVKVGEYVPDLIVFGAIIVDTKTIEKITSHEKGQILNYLKITKLKLGLILNFKHARLEWERLVL